MVEDLKRQASELYRERTQKEEILTSASLSIKKLIYLSLGLLLAVGVVIQLMGGFQPRPNPVISANTPPPLVKEAPPPELLEPEPQLSAAKSPSPDSKSQEAASRREVETPAANVPEVKQAPRGAARPTKEGAEKPQPTVTSAEKSRANPLSVPENKVSAPVAPETSAIEEARRVLARDIVMEKNSALAKLIGTPNAGEEYKGWKAEAEGTDVYQVTFTFLDKESGSVAHYVWRVNITARTIAPLSYYARKLA